MTLAVAQAINGFPTGEPQSPAFVTVPAPILDQILEELQALRAEVQDLKADNQNLRGELTSLEDRHRERLQAHSARIAGLEMAQDALEVVALSKPSERSVEPGKRTKKTDDHLTQMAMILGAKEKRLIESEAPREYVRRLRKEGMTFSQFASLMGLTVDRIRQLSRIAATDPRFNITWHPRRKNTKIIKLRSWDSLGF